MLALACATRAEVTVEVSRLVYVMDAAGAAGAESLTWFGELVKAVGPAAAVAFLALFVVSLAWLNDIRRTHKAAVADGARREESLKAEHASRDERDKHMITALQATAQAIGVATTTQTMSQQVMASVQQATLAAHERMLQTLKDYVQECRDVEQARSTQIAELLGEIRRQRGRG